MGGPRGTLPPRTAFITARRGRGKKGEDIRVVDVGAADAEIYGALVEEFRARRIDLGLARQEVRLVNA